ncbi:hypothetical protein NPIL_235201 [Nephila pilipes]|uniref:Uncharacterized protein n=1 Tax=Nephila pilipes TaxID=299642 RepID=A0A8X6JH34_NEPPI|nr:hypothetical protein NPIL_235201 [Nephila pilipes]
MLFSRFVMSVQRNHAIYKLPTRHMDRHTPLFVIPLVTHVYRYIFPMDYILTSILLQKQLFDPPGTACTETQCCARVTDDSCENETVVPNPSY